MRHVTTVNFECATKGCSEHIQLTYARPDEQADIGENVLAALREAAVSLGWRHNTTDGKIYGPMHAAKLRCKRCLGDRDDCGCMAGPRWEAVP